MALLDDHQHLNHHHADWGAIADSVEVTVFHERFASQDELVQALQPFDIVALMRERSRLTAEVIAHLPRLRLIVTTGPRTDAVDLDEARRRDIPVCATRHSMTSTIEFVWGLILACTRSIPHWDAHLRRGGWQPDARLHPLGREVTGKTLGILGLGEIGTAVAHIASAFDMNVVAWSENLTPEIASKRGAAYVSRDELFRSADVLSIHCRLSARTRGLVSVRELGLMKSTAYLVNTSRGAIVDEQALVRALQAGCLAGAGLDVFTDEPLASDHPLRRMDNVVITPHAAALAEGHVSAWFQDIGEDVRAWLDGAPIRVLT
jgi:phosphoglycerate dehydrogenase-like enzyme